MKKISRLLLLPALLLLAFFAFGQDSTVVDPPDNPVGSENPAWNWFLQNWVLVIAFIYEAIVRFIPNYNSYSWLRLIMKVIDLLVPDRAMVGSVHTETVSSKSFTSMSAGNWAGRILAFSLCLVVGFGIFWFTGLAWVGIVVTAVLLGVVYLLLK